MPKRHRVLTALLVTPLIAMLATAVFGRPHHGRAGAPQCPLDCGVKLDHGPWVYSGGHVVTTICLSAGMDRFSFTQDGTDGCFTVTGLGTTKVTVTENKRGEREERGERREHESERHRHCRDISSVVFYYECSGLFPG